jgi:hypothetical protein
MSNEFTSELEKIMLAEELNFPPTPAFGKYKPFLEHAIAHEYVIVARKPSAN